MVSEKKKAILKSAEMLFSTHGFNQTTVADIAQESGIHEASIYSYFGNKRNILFTIYANYLQNAIESLKEHFQGMKEPGPKLRKSIWHYLDDMKNNQYYAKTLMMAQRENPDFYSSEQVRYIKEYSSLVLGVVITGQKEGFFLKNLSPRLIRNMAMGTCVFTVFDSLIHNRPYDPNEMSDIIYQLVINATCVDSPVAENSVKMTRSEKAELRRSQIIETSIQVFSNKGFSNATISEVANHANLGDATLYEYFDNKEAILMGTAETYLQNLVSDEDINLRNSSEPEKALRKLIWRWIWQLYTYKEFSRVLVLELFRNIRFYSSPGYEYLVAFHEKIRETVQQGQKEGIFIEDVPFPTYFHMITGTFDQFLLSQFLLNRPPLGIAELNDTVDSFVRAIKTRKNP
jgi:TetR/AcrR family fatty acid metabolism transcriptional regulator